MLSGCVSVPDHPARYREPVAIEPVDIDFMGHVNNASYLKWVQAAVIGHWRSVAPADAVARYRWIAVRHEITYRRPAFLHDALIASVRLDRVKRESAFYDTAFTRDGELLADVTSRWCCVDAATHRPVRLDEAIVALFLPER